MSGTAPESTAQRHAAAGNVKPLNGAPRPIAFPPRAEVEQLCRTRANADNAMWQQQVERREALLHAARDDGYDLGERIGYLSGWHWGVLCGFIAGALFTTTALLIIQYVPAMIAAWWPA